MTEVKHQDLKKLMVALEDSTVLFQRNISNIPPKIIQTNFKKIHHDIIIKTQEILKEEWERVKVDSYADPNTQPNI
jgi:hypothetical protein